MQERAEACASGLDHAAQDLALGAHLHPQIHEFALLLFARGDIGDADYPQTRLVRGFRCGEFEAVVRRLVSAVRLGQAQLHVLERIGFRALAAGQFEQVRDVVSNHAQGLGGNQGPDQFFEIQVGEILAAKQGAKMTGNLRQNLAIGVEQEQAEGTGLQNCIRQPIACADQFLFFPLMTLLSDEHGLDSLPNVGQAGDDGSHSLDGGFTYAAPIRGRL